MKPLKTLSSITLACASMLMVQSALAETKAAAPAPATAATAAAPAAEAKPAKPVNIKANNAKAKVAALNILIGDKKKELTAAGEDKEKVAKINKDLAALDKRLAAANAQVKAAGG